MLSLMKTNDWKNKRLKLHKGKGLINLNKYEELLIEAEELGLIVDEKPLLANDGRIKGNHVLIRKDLLVNAKTCVLAEEVGHHKTTVGNIIDQTNSDNQKQEYVARKWAYAKLIKLRDLIKASKNGCRNIYETADYLEVTEEFLEDTLKYYNSKYGIYIEFNNHIIFFNPLQIYTKEEYLSYNYEFALELCL